MNLVTGTQVEQRDALIYSAIQRISDRINEHRLSETDYMNEAFRAAVVLTLPEPDSSEMAAEQIAALSGDILDYTKVRSEDYRTMQLRIVAEIDGKASFETDPLDTWTGDVLPEFQVITAASLRRTIKRVLAHEGD
jgi:hypothetical protein